MKKFTKALRKDLKVRRTGFLGMGRKVEVTNDDKVNGPISYRVDRSRADEAMARFLNSKIPVAVIRPKL